MQKPSKRPVLYCSRACSNARYGISKGSAIVSAAVLTRLYTEEGAPIGAIARQLGIGHRSVRALLTTYGIPQRSPSENKRASYAKMTAEQRSAMTAASHEAIRGRKRSHDDLCKRAQGKQRSAQMSDDERSIFDALRARGLTPVPLYAVDKYNIDFAFPEIKLAIEYNGGNWHNTPSKIAGDEVKADFLKAGGWTLLVFPRLAKSRKTDSGNTRITLNDLLDQIASEVHRLSLPQVV
jgi:very-short-patch-repair endonuclease